MPVPLGATGLLELAGPDAFAFARGQFTSDVQLAPGHWQWSAWLDPQGRVRSFGALLAAGEQRLLLWLPLGDAPALAAALLPFRFRSRLEINSVEAALLVAPGEAPQAGAFTSDGPGWRLGLAGGRAAWLRPGPADAADAPALAAWRREDIAAGLPWLDAAVSGRFVPQALDLERLDAIRFDKGCFPGQEVAARLHFRGGNKRHPLALTGAGTPPAPGTPVNAAEGPAVGTVLYSATAGTQRFECLAVVHQDADATALQLADGTGLQPLAPPGNASA